MTTLGRVVRAVPPASGAVVMGTGIVSIDLLNGGHSALSVVPLVVAACAWILLGVLLGGRFRFDRARFAREATSPAALTGVAGTAVLGTRLSLLGWQWAGISLLIIAAVLWGSLLRSVLRNWMTPTVGASFVLVVSTESLAVLAATLGMSEHAAWLIVVALVPLTLGLPFYVFVVARFDARQLIRGRGDHWVAGGALAISALACARVTQGAETLSALGPAHEALKVATLVVWVAAMCWLPVLVVVEVAAPRLAYDVRRWSTVFPVGMYAACGYAAGTVLRASPIVAFARAWSWIALAVWLVVFAAMLWQIVPLLRATPAP
ncbi:MAG TPA: tellurite resistance/C4-dicarboxylate transporter family protein [Candidatus Saccharimonadales bacterium]|nr:tellurite resistance/C4-dicarboxylate transporter family protein [Candidatus Saccharimonadales bacterium]